MKAKGLRGQGERVSQMLVSKIPLAEERLPAHRKVSLSGSLFGGQAEHTEQSDEPVSEIQCNLCRNFLCVLSVSSWFDRLTILSKRSASKEWQKKVNLGNLPLYPHTQRTRGK